MGHESNYASRTSTPNDSNKELDMSSPSPDVPCRKITWRKKDKRRASLVSDEVWESPLVSQQMEVETKVKRKSAEVQAEDSGLIAVGAIGVLGDVAIRASPKHDESVVIIPNKPDRHRKTTAAAPAEKNPKRLLRAPMAPGADDEMEPSRYDHPGGRIPPAGSPLDAPHSGIRKSSGTVIEQTGTIGMVIGPLRVASQSFLEQREEGEHGLDHGKVDKNGRPGIPTAPLLIPQQNHSKSLADAGDAKVSSARRVGENISRMKIAEPPPADIERDPMLIEVKQDAEKGHLEELVALNMSVSITPRSSSATSFRGLAGLFRDDEDANNKRTCLCLAFLAIFILGALAAIIVPFLYPSSEVDNTNSFIDVPSVAPTTFYNGVLPLYTQQALDNSSSPQARSLFWLEHDDGRPSLSVLSALQRFVLATLFYATGGDHWGQAEHWLNYSQSECSWYTTEIQSACSSDGRFHTLSLPANALRGTWHQILCRISTSSTSHFFVRLRTVSIFLYSTQWSRIW
jgi:hypothetical protein